MSSAPTFKGTKGAPDMTFAPLRLVRTSKSKNGYYVYLGKKCVLTAGPIEIEHPEGAPKERVNVTLTLAVWDSEGSLENI